MKAGANFILLGPSQTMLKSLKPVISVCATRTYCYTNRIEIPNVLAA